MGGLEKITEHIINNAQKSADEIIANANQKADEIKKSAEEKCKKLILENDLNIKTECEKIKQMAEAEKRQNERQSVLDTKNRVIKEIIKSAKEKIFNMQKAEYREFIKTILKNSITGEKGEILFAEADTDLVDAEFKSDCNKITNGMLEFSDEIAPIEKGFIIRYGKIEQNCSINSIIEDKYNELTDLVNSCITEG